MRWGRLLLLVALLVGALGAPGWSPSAAAAQLGDGGPLTALSYRLPDATVTATPGLVAEVASPLTAASQIARTIGPLPAPYEVSSGRQRYFSETAHFLRGAFLQFWETHGQTPVLGLPLTEPIVEDGLAVQYLERARLEYHPEYASAGNPVLLTRLGVVMAQVRNLQFGAVPPPLSSGPDTYYFAETGHNLSNAFLSYWQRNGGLAVFGYPISEEFVETNAADGQQYSVQYFERNRFEWHPERGPAYNVQLGLLGVEYARLTALDPLARVLLPSPIAEAGIDSSDDPRLADLVDDGLLQVVQTLGRTPQFRWVPAVILKNRVHVEFQAFDEEGVAGAFVATRSKDRPYVIVVPQKYREASPEALGSVLAHEATHAYDYTEGATPRNGRCSIEEELRAYMNGLSAWLLLRGDTALADRYAPNTLESAVNQSLANFYGQVQLSLDFDVAAGRAYIGELYGSTCGK